MAFRVSTRPATSQTTGANSHAAVIDKQASGDLEQDALDLVDLVGDQVRRLGAHSRTKKAITIFGHVGRQNFVSQFPDEAEFKLEPRKPRTQRTLVQLIYETCVTFIASAISSIMLWTFGLLRWIWKTTNANKMILLMLIGSVLINGFYTSRDTYEWWNERVAENFMSRLGVHPDHVMSKGIYMRDIDEAIANTTIARNGTVSDCFATFQEQTVRDHGSSLSLDISGPRDSVTKSAARRLQQTRERLAMYRHNLLVALRVVNSIEKELIQNEWERWLRQELKRCRQVEVLLGKSSNEDEAFEDQMDRMGQTVFADLSDDVRQWYETYCTSCHDEQEQIEKNGRVYEVS